MQRRTFLVAPLVAAAPFLQGVPLLAAETYPSKPIAVVVPWPAGGSPDVIVRALTAKMSADWNDPILVENKPGAEGRIGSSFAAKSAADGYTWLIGTMTTTMMGSLFKNVSWSAARDFAGVAMIAEQPLIAVVPETLPVNSFKEFVALAKSEPGKLNYMNSAIGSATHLDTELLKQKEHIDLVPVLYQGQPPAMPDLVSGRLQFGLVVPVLAAPLIRVGKLKPLAVAFPKRISEFPSLPTFAELGAPEADAFAHFYLVVPKGTPREIVARISAEVQKAIADPTVRKRIEAAGAVVADPTTPEQVDAFTKSDTQRWVKFFKEHPVNAE